VTRVPVFLSLLAFAAPVRAQDTLSLDALQRAAVRRDPRAGQFALEDSAAALRIGAIRTGRLPRLTLAGDGSVQSEVTTFGGSLPGVDIPVPPKEQYQATLRVDQLLYDGGAIAGRQAVERARLARARAGVQTTLYGLRGEVNAAFFRALLLQERLAEVDALIVDLDARLGLVRAHVEEGTALPGDSALVLAELLSARQDRTGLDRERRAQLEVLERLTGESIDDADRLAEPSLATRVDSVRALPGGVPRARPEFASFERARRTLDAERSALGAGLRPQISAFAEGGVGRPGLDLFERSTHGFWLAGVRVRWSPWDWGGTHRQQDALEVERRIVDTNEEALAERLGRDVRDDLAEIDRLTELLDTDDRIVALREQVERQALAQLEEGTITATDYIDRRTELLRARLALRQHSVELVRARAGYLTTLGLGVK